jgi:hypothetical protein
MICRADKLVRIQISIVPQGFFEAARDLLNDWRKEFIVAPAAACNGV